MIFGLKKRAVANSLLSPMAHFALLKFVSKMGHKTLVHRAAEKIGRKALSRSCAVQ